MTGPHRRTWPLAAASALALAAGAAVPLSAPSGCDRAWDARTGATIKARPARPLPPFDQTYSVLGEAAGLANYVINKYNRVLLRGGEITGRTGMKTLRRWGVRTIVSVTPTDRERALAGEYGIALVELPFEKAAGIPPDVAGKFLRAVTGGQGPFYVHCHGGAHRAGALCALYRVKVEGWSFEKAAVEFGQLGGNLMADHKMMMAVKAAAAAAAAPDASDG